MGRVITSAFGLLLALALAGCEGPSPRSGVPVSGTAIAPSATGDGPAETAETQPPAEPDANAGVAAEPGQPSPPSPGPQAPATASEPSDSLAASVRNIAPAAGPAPAPAAPRKPAIDDDPDRLMGLGTVELTRMLGDPRFVRRDSSAQLWRYRNKSCILDLFLYRGAGRAEYFVSHIEARHGEGGAAEKRECFGALLLERREHEAGYDLL